MPTTDSLDRFPGPRPLATFALVLLGTLAGLSVLAAGRTARADIASTFHDNDEGWRVTGDTTSAIPIYNATDGNPGGYLSANDTAAGGVWYWSAPASFLGDASAYAGGSLRYDLRQSAIDNGFGAVDVELIGGGLTLAIDTVPPPATTWTPYVVPLSAGSWRINDLSGAIATAAQLNGVLQQLTSLKIRGEFRTGADTGSLDNVILSSTSTGGGGVFGGVYFPQGADSFADAVGSYDPVIRSNQPAAEYRDPSQALGPPNYPQSDPSNGHVTLGDGGSITLRFTNNVLTGSGDARQDLWVFEVGPDVEDTFVEVSRDGLAWRPVGKVAGAVSGVDLDAFGLGVNDRFTWVRLTDDPDADDQTGASVGADIDAIGAISTQLCNIPPGDANGDGLVDRRDVQTLVLDFGQTIPGPAVRSDFNCDGVVDMFDAHLLQQHLTPPAGPAASPSQPVPEPLASSLVALAAPLLAAVHALRRRHRGRAKMHC